MIIIHKNSKREKIKNKKVKMIFVIYLKYTHIEGNVFKNNLKNKAKKLI